MLVFAMLNGPMPAVAQQVSAQFCGSLANAYGPLDYRTERGNPLHLVESAHFTPEVEALIRGKNSSGPGGDIDYTLRAYPNHHRALVSVLRWTERAKSPVLPGLARPAECYFERAVRWRPDDAVARMLYAKFLYMYKRPGEAVPQLEIAASNAETSPLTQFNVGLVYFEGGDHERALVQAHKALALGYARPELRERLQQAGKWQELAAASSKPDGTAASAPEAAAADTPAAGEAKR
jgi:tetratricopeptide (TPR) repeat protein